MEKLAFTSWVRKILAVVFLLTLTGMTGLFAIDIVLVSPQLGPVGNPVVDAIQDELDRVFREESAPYKDLIEGIDSNPRKMIGAFATSSIFSSTGASLRTFQGYNAFALTVGAMAGVQLPVSINSMYRDMEYIADRLFDDINRDGDLRVGMNPQFLNAQLGINTSKFLLKGLYVGLKGGYMSLPPLNLDDFQMSFQTWSIGGMINYQLIPQIRVLGGIFVWRGLNIGTGFVHQRTSFNMDVALIPEDGSTSDLVNIGETGATLDLGDPTLRFRFGVYTYTVPLEAVTSIRLLGFMNFSIGGGVDFGFGSASMRGSLDTRIEVKNLPSVESVRLYQVQPGRMYVSLGGSNTPTLVNPKVMVSLGISAGSVIILDIPVTYYFLNNGYNVGITFGVAR